MTAEEIMGWRDLKAIAFNVHRKCRCGDFLEPDDFRMAAIAEVWPWLEYQPDATPSYLRQLARRTMINYGKKALGRRRFESLDQIDWEPASREPSPFEAFLGANPKHLGRELPRCANWVTIKETGWRVPLWNVLQ